MLLLLHRSGGFNTEWRLLDGDTAPPGRRGPDAVRGGVDGFCHKNTRRELRRRRLVGGKASSNTASCSFRLFPGAEQRTRAPLFFFFGRGVSHSDIISLRLERAPWEIPFSAWLPWFTELTRRYNYCIPA